MPDSFKKILHEITVIMDTTFFVSSIEIIWFVSKNVSVKNVKFDIFVLLAGFVLGMFIYYLDKLILNGLMFKYDYGRKTSYYILKAVFYIVLECLLVYCYKNMNFNISLYVIFIVSAIYMIAYKIIKRVSHNKGEYEINAENTEPVTKENAEKLAFVAEIKAVAENMKARYEKLKRKNSQNEYNCEDFFIMKNKEINSSHITYIKVIILFLLVATIPVFSFLLSGTFSRAISLYMMMAIVQLCVFRRFFKLHIKIHEGENYVMKKCQARGIDINEYVKSINETGEI